MKTKKEKLANFSKKRNRIASKACGDQHGVDGEREEDVWDGHEEEQDVNRPNLFPPKRHHEDHNAVRYHRNEDWNENISNIWIWQKLQLKK